jgi:hypothetical protein
MGRLAWLQEHQRQLLIGHADVFDQVIIPRQQPSLAVFALPREELVGEKVDLAHVERLLVNTSKPRDDAPSCADLNMFEHNKAALHAALVLLQGGLWPRFDHRAW